LANVLRSIGTTYGFLGEEKKKRDYLEQAMRLGGTDEAWAWDTLSTLGDYARAIELLQNQISRAHERRAYKDEARAWLNLAIVYLETNKKPQAEESVAHAVQMWHDSKDTFVEFLAGAAGAYQQVGLPRKALDVFQEYLKEVQNRGPEGFPQYPAFLN